MPHEARSCWRSSVLASVVLIKPYQCPVRGVNHRISTTPPRSVFPGHDPSAGYGKLRPLLWVHPVPRTAIGASTADGTPACTLEGPADRAEHLGAVTPDTGTQVVPCRTSGRTATQSGRRWWRATVKQLMHPVETAAVEPHRSPNSARASPYSTVILSAASSTVRG